MQRISFLLILSIFFCASACQSKRGLVGPPSETLTIDVEGADLARIERLADKSEALRRLEKDRRRLDNRIDRLERRISKDRRKVNRLTRRIDRNVLRANEERVKRLELDRQIQLQLEAIGRQGAGIQP
jgi:septal ring factor EnvC (AmiA/AmiB activator)